MAYTLSTPRTNNAVNNRNGRYTQGGTTDRFSNRLGFWERRKLVQRDSDITHIIQPAEDRRPDLVSAHVYGKDIYIWIVLQFNNIVDIETEFVAGRELRLPNPQRLALDIISRPTGGNVVRN